MWFDLKLCHIINIMIIIIIISNNNDDNRSYSRHTVKASTGQTLPGPGATDFGPLGF